jgi:outer membrane protein assembly factor BamB
MPKDRLNRAWLLAGAMALSALLSWCHGVHPPVRVVWKTQLGSDWIHGAAANSTAVFLSAGYPFQDQARLYKVRLSDGSKVWEVRLPKEGTSVCADERVVCVVLKWEELSVLSAETGAVKWRFRGVSGINAPVCCRSRVIVPAKGEPHAGLAAFDERDGRPVWRDPSAVYFTRDATGRALFAWGPSGVCRIEPETGAVVWRRTDLGSPGDVMYSSADLYVISRGHVVCIDPETSQVRWRQPCGDDLLHAPLSPEQRTNPVVAAWNGTGATCLDGRTGQLRWRWSANAARREDIRAVWTRDRFVLSYRHDKRLGMDGYFLCWHDPSDGAFLGSLGCAAPVLAPSCNGLVIGDETGRVMLVRPADG